MNSAWQKKRKKEKGEKLSDGNKFHRWCHKPAFLIYFQQRETHLGPRGSLAVQEFKIKW